MQDRHGLTWILGLAVALGLAPGCDDGDDDGDDAAGSTGHPHASEGGLEDTAHASDATTGGVTEGSGEAADSSGDGGSGAATAYCACMLVNCHDGFHAKYGDGDDVATPACQADAATLPSVGMDAMSGDSIECRMHFCDEAAMDEAACAAALGDEVCVAQ